jgi:hypothetical protein
VNGERIIITSKEPDMNIAEMRREPTVETLHAGTIDMKLEVVVIPVSDVDRAKRFYGDLGFSLDLDYTAGNGFRCLSNRQQLRQCFFPIVEGPRRFSLARNASFHAILV